MQNHTGDTGRKAPAATLRDMVGGARQTQMLYVAAKLGVADALKDGPLAIDDLARTVGAHPRSLYRLLRALASMGIFAETEDGQFELTPLAEPLQSERPDSVRGAAIMWGEEWFWRT